MANVYLTDKTAVNSADYLFCQDGANVNKIDPAKISAGGLTGGFTATSITASTNYEVGSGGYVDLGEFVYFCVGLKAKVGGTVTSASYTAITFPISARYNTACSLSKAGASAMFSGSAYVDSSGNLIINCMGDTLTSGSMMYYVSGLYKKA